MSELELQLQASLASTHNGSFLWRIPEIARRRRDAIEERITSIYSPPFYTGRYGSMAMHMHVHIHVHVSIAYQCTSAAWIMCELPLRNSLSCPSLLITEFIASLSLECLPSVSMYQGLSRALPGILPSLGSYTDVVGRAFLYGIHFWVYQSPPWALP